MAGNMGLIHPFVFNQFGTYGSYAQVRRLFCLVSLHLFFFTSSSNLIATNRLLSDRSTAASGHHGGRLGSRRRRLYWSGAHGDCHPNPAVGPQRHRQSRGRAIGARFDLPLVFPIVCLSPS